jgi:hypothetical protein
VVKTKMESRASAHLARLLGVMEGCIVTVSFKYWNRKWKPTCRLTGVLVLQLLWTCANTTQGDVYDPEAALALGNLAEETLAELRLLLHAPGQNPRHLEFTNVDSTTG